MTAKADIDTSRSDRFLPTMFDFSAITFVAPWRPLQHDVEREGLPRQLAKELSPRHPLWGSGCEVIGRADTNDDILVACADGRFANVHLTWGQGPGDAEYPHTVFYGSTQELNDALWRDAVWQGFVEEYDPNDPRLSADRD